LYINAKRPRYPLNAIQFNFISYKHFWAQKTKHMAGPAQGIWLTPKSHKVGSTKTTKCQPATTAAKSHQICW